MKLNPKIVRFFNVFCVIVLVVLLFGMFLNVFILNKRVSMLEERPVIREVKTVVATPTLKPTVTEKVNKVFVPVATQSAR